ncbi:MULTISPECIES: glycoside hydrolase family 28 protein [unclassified Agrobacterium]|uniref:polygalacturonase PglB n=1 Tax=unclassified Agrobacterium TaxID=2632611 RepID=UPI00244AD6DC|nr:MULTISPECIES: glycoside hydrolase family 28 protein [unclassified Agrobacterium]MDH0615551.1 glycoside hydrolase family 28 protein [Agrobacterium sp. GD03872]MDH0697527.1 glycoside hydrolase family 28 protein [Agrobacterium sp. GD03871]MDH1060694.1 glycoside hydrolase family 28 protein [Agrobacterium sp. GD03992]MDH2213309.1 glycoside hydrolase family 28 protein [Agrobacterium sp. GD03643]MDH2221939.1 glycoside hydrolase family 28 protein [Agrobacterium sp. GD03638]
MNISQDITVAAGGLDATAAIQQAIDTVSAAGGGRVSLSAGRHVSAGLHLKSGVELHLAEDAVLAPVSDYDAYVLTRVSVIAEDSDRGMIIARGAHDIAVTGPGRIEAGGENFIVGDDKAMGTYVPAKKRPRVMVLESCRNVRLENLSVSGSPMWTLHMVDCEDLHFRSLRIENDRRLPNTDGIVLDACRRALIEDCFISTADDGICLKTSAGPDGKAVGVCDGITVRRCIVSSVSCALKLGTESFGDFTNVAFEDCKIVESNRGIGLFSRDGGAMRNIRFSRIEAQCHETPGGFWGSGEAVTVTVVDRRPERQAGSVDNLVVEYLSGSMEGAINLVATSKAGIHNVRLERITLAQQPGTLGTGLQYDLRPTNADIAPSPDAAGRANAWTRDAEGRIVGLEDYPGGMPAVYLAGVEGFAARDVAIKRTTPLPKGWNSQEIVATTSLPEGSR